MKNNLAGLLMLIGLFSASNACAGVYHALDSGGTVVNIPAEGGAATSLPSSLNGDGLAVDDAGNYIIATGTSLVRMTWSGSSSLIANAPAGSNFIDVTIDGSGNYLVTDNAKHQVLRVSADGSVIVPVVTYPVRFPTEWEDAWIRIDPQTKNYIVLEDNGRAHLHVITPGGAVTSIGLTGSTPQQVGGFAFDAAGNYVVTDYWNHAVDTITPAGFCTTLREDAALFVKPVGIARDSSSGNFILADFTLNKLYSMTPDGGAVTTVLSGFPLDKPCDVAVSVPEPASLLSMVISGVVLLALGRGRVPAGALHP